MSGILIANTDDTISISAPDVYGANFKLSLYSQTLGSWTIQDAQMIEYLDSFTVNSQTVASVASIGDTTIDITDATGFTINDTIIIKSFVYRITAISSNSITLHNPVQENLIIGDIANASGNMSLYHITLNISDIGNYLIRAKDMVYGIEITDSVKVVEKSIETMVRDIKNLEYAILGN